MVTHALSPDYKPLPQPYPLAIFLFLVFLWCPGAKMAQIRYTEQHSVLPQEGLNQGLQRNDFFPSSAISCLPPTPPLAAHLGLSTE